MIPSAAPYSVTWPTERQVTTEIPLIERVFFACDLTFLRLAFALTLPDLFLAWLARGQVLEAKRRSAEHGDYAQDDHA